MARSVVLQLMVDLKNFGSGLQSAARMADNAFNKMGASAARGSQMMQQAQKSTGGLAGVMHNLGGSLVRNILFFAGYYNALVVMNSVLTATFSHILDLDEGLKKVQSITQESDESIAALRESLLDMAQGGQLAGKSAAEIAQAMFDIVQSGFKSADALHIAAIAAEAAATGFTDADIAGRAVVSVLNAFALPAEQARHVADILFKTVDLGVISFGDLAQNLGDFIGTMAMANVPLEEMGAVMSVLTKRGISGAEAATSFNRMMLQFIKPSEKARKAAAALGIELSAEALASKGLVGALLEIEQKTGGSATALGQIFDEVRGLRGASILLTDDGKELVQFLEDFGGASAGAGALAEAFAIRSEALRFRLQMLGSQLLALSTRFLTPVVDLLAKLVGGLSDLIADKDGHVKWFKGVVLGASGLGDALKDLWDTIRGLGREGRGGGGFIDLLKNLGEKAWSAVPLIAQLIAQLVRFIDFLLENKVTLYALIAAFTAMLVAAHPVLFLFMTLVTAVGTLRDENATLGEKLVAIGVILVALPALLIALAGPLLTLFFRFTNLFNVVGHGTGVISRMMAQWELAKSSAAVFAEKVANAWHIIRDATQGAITKLDTFRHKMGLAMPEPKAKIGVEAKAPAGGAPKGLAGFLQGLGKGLPQGIGALIGGAFSNPATLAKIGTAIAVFAGAIGTMLQTALAIALVAAPYIAIVAAVLVAVFLIYKYRKQIWDGLTTLYDVLRDFFTKDLPDWFRTHFTAKNIGRLVGFAAVALIVAMFPIPILIIKFRNQIMGFLRGVGSFIGDIPNKIIGYLTTKTGGHAVWEWIMLAIFPVPTLLTKFRGDVASFLAGIASFVAEIPGHIAAFIGDHWLDILTAIFPVPMAIIRWHEEIARWLASIMEMVAGIPGRIAAFIGDHWKEIIGALLGVPKWTAEFITKATEFVTGVVAQIPGVFAGIGTAIASAIKSAFLSGIDFMGWLGDAFGAFWDKVPGPVKDFMEGVGGPVGDFIGWLKRGQAGFENFIGGMALVGEKGPELVRLPRGSDVVANHNLGQALRSQQQAAAGPTIHAEANINATMGDWSALKRMVLRAVEERLDDAAARAGMAKPRFGTLGAGIPRT